MMEASRVNVKQIDVQRYLPHRPPMLLVHHVHEVLEDGLVCVGGVGRDSPFVVNGCAPAVLAVELAAQTAAVAMALGVVGARTGDPADGKPPAVGFLATLRDVRCHLPGLSADALYLATVQCTRALPRLAMFEATVVSQDDSSDVLSATFSVALP